MAARHIGQGSVVEYRTQPLRKMVFRARAALRMQLTSAWAVGSLSRQTVLCVAATTAPSLAMTAPNGDCPAAMPSRVTRIAWRMKSSSVMMRDPLGAWYRVAAGRGETGVMILPPSVCRQAADRAE